MNLYILSQSSNTCQVVEALMMVMSDHHYLDEPSEHDQIHFPLQDAHPDPALLIENSSFQRFHGLQ